MSVATPNDEFVSFSLYKSGIAITSHLHSRFLNFDTLAIGNGLPENQESLASITKIGIIGLIGLGPGFLVLIEEQNNVLNYKEIDIWNITKTMILPLKYELAVGYFGITNENNEANDVNNDNDDENRDNNNLINNDDKAEMDPAKKFAEQMNKTKDVLFSKIGIYADDLKSTASLSFSRKPVLQRNYDSYIEEPSSDSTSDLTDFTENDSIKMKRSITLRRSTTETPNKKTDLKYKDISKPMLQKFEKQLKTYFDTKDFYYSSQLDITKDIEFQDDTLVNSTKTDGGSFWYNKHISKKLQGTELSKFVIQGFVNSINVDLNFSNSIASKTAKVLLLSKRSTKRAGLRYLRRGIDDDSNVANFVKTSQILILDNALENHTLFTRFDLIRGSIPLFFQQNPANLKPVPYLTRDPEESNEVFQSHFKHLKESYGSISCISLVERSKRENTIGSAYYDMCCKNDIEISWFDFHKVCKNMNFDNVVQLLDDKLENSCGLTVEQQLLNYGWYDSVTQDDQLGVFRVNCIDCLDRTNLVQKFMSEFILTHSILEKYCLNIERKDLFQTSFNNLWADNGDYISRQYASTNALKGDYTRTSKRNYKGLMTDAWLTMSRYYSGYISDFYKQCFIEYLLGYQDYKIFEEFESTLNVIDPNDLNENLNKKNSYLKKIIEDLDVCSEDLILVGSWNGFESSLKYNDLKLPYNDIALILTNKMVYFVRHTAETIDEVVKFSVFEVNEIIYGSYFKNTHTSLSTNPKRNIGLKFIFKKSYDEEVENFMTVKFPIDMEYSKIKYIINLISKTCVSSTLQSKDIVTLEQAQKKVNVLDVIEHRFKKMVWG